ncbi:MAG: RNA pyrophosphohydrolase [Alphaproteobacteria bacterium]|nr:RNA pyrophosphohydrolase [Alphaproteobacteria bacterium]
MQNNNEALYRPCVGIALFNAQGKVLIGERITNKGAWQMPQGGIEEHEDLEAAIFREMREEIGTDKARIIGAIDEWLYYDVPDHISQTLWGGKWRGQKQKWVALAFEGTDNDIILDTFDEPEFAQWKWVALEDILDLAVPFKRDTYRRVIEGFRKLSKQSHLNNV